MKGAARGRYARRTALGVLLAFTVPVAFVFLAACDGDDGDPGPLAVTVRAEVVEADAPVEVEATAVRDDPDGFAHGVLVTWRGDERARLDDVRFVHHEEVDDGHLVTAGRGCGAQWMQPDGELGQACTADLQLIELEPDEAHEYPVRVVTEVGPLRLRPGTYTFEEPLSWFRFQGGDAFGDPAGTFTVRLTYEVTRAP